MRINMTEQEFLKTLDTECVLISLEKYESLLADATILTLVKRAIENGRNEFGLSCQTVKTLETLLDVKGGCAK